MRDTVQFIDVSPKQLVSVAASLIPFLENDDANRALMGSNMQRQAVPLLRARAPFVGTGMEYITARDSGAVIVARRSGSVDFVDSQRIVVRVESETDEGKEMGADIYSMTKFKRSNQNTCINQKPIVRVGQVTPKGETQLTPEEKLLRAIFGEKAGDVRDASLICPPGIEGIIVGVKIFSRKGIEKDDRAKAIEQEELDMMEKNLQDEVRILHDEVKKRVIMMLKGAELRADLFDEYGRERLQKKGTVLTQDILQDMPYESMIRLKIQTDDPRLEDELNELEH